MKTAKQIWLASLLVSACGAGQEPLTSSSSPAQAEEQSDSRRESKADAGARSDAGTRADAGKTSTQARESTGTEEEEEACEAHVVAARKTTPDMLIVLDRSGSMAPEGNQNGADRWRGSVDAVTQVTDAFSSKINFGLMTFPSQQGAPAQAGGGGLGGLLGGLLGGGGGDITQMCAAGAIDVDVGVSKGAEIKQALSTMAPGGLTPTAASLDAALQAIGNADPVGDQGVIAPKYVLLVTDGDPNCSNDFANLQGGGGGGIDGRARQDTIAAIERLQEAGVQTFVVGYQTAGTSFAQTLDQMAAAGGTGDTAHRSVNSGADLTASFSEIAGRALSCSYKLDSPVADPAYVLVTVRGKSLQFQNPTDGWSLGSDKQTVTVTGAACDQVQAGSVFNVEVACTPVYVQ